MPSRAGRRSEGGERLGRDGFIYRRAVASSRLGDLREEIFGPVAPIATFSDEAGQFQGRGCNPRAGSTGPQTPMALAVDRAHVGIAVSRGGTRRRGLV